VTLLRSYLVGKASTMVCVFCILDDLCCQEEVNKGGGVAIHAPASDRVHEVGPKQSSLKVVHIPAIVITITITIIYRHCSQLFLPGTYYVCLPSAMQLSCNCVS